MFSIHSRTRESVAFGSPQNFRAEQAAEQDAKNKREAQEEQDRLRAKMEEVERAKDQAALELARQRDSRRQKEA